MKTTQAACVSFELCRLKEDDVGQIMSLGNSCIKRVWDSVHIQAGLHTGFFLGGGGGWTWPGFGC